MLSSKNWSRERSIAERKQEILREKKLFVLDNSLRESTVGQLRGHTIENKWKIYEEVKNMLSKNVLKNNTEIVFGNNCHAQY
jgi:hypothetical protein